ncbi:MAG: hypothetical protein A2X19_07615 [Bacteroidetes bacterium GWE2_39_28]|nr:MAG: hypothetical protein A2X19_07615 [Bacteroidetes bacterium GWE2_39_28]OFY12638.1 MAG: hypothetical protein A2X16_02765 [Bacteroidetes bacterium GWF2_39_10]OFZ09346.1 MAG: hypothetical protein A2322_09580 [Bacteroidetes bacterium RIFOXYB2_FULL_39_7]OFZ09644.1 MAG: hypothetical protein A2465_00230 [Bacteroidetes bacterium RIFOXYC2_FULL_39_11]HCT94648.1 hypothetical protein [Rikenellaceae bacterium]
MSLIILSVIVVAICVALMSFNIIFRKNGKFPETEIGHNKEMRKLGLKCAKTDERILWKKGNSCSTCSCGSSEE